MPDPNIPPSGAPAAVIEQPSQPSNRKITCGYCECVLALDGGVLRTSERVKALNAQEDRIEKLKLQLAQLETDLTAARAEVATAQAQLAAITRPSEAPDPWR